MRFWHSSGRSANTRHARTRPSLPSGGTWRTSSRNKARASTAALAKSKSKQLERLELTEIASEEPTARIRAPRVEPRKGPALRCRDLAIGYPERQIAADVQLEIDHGTRAAVVGDNGQGKTTFLRTWWILSSHFQEMCAGGTAAK